MVQRWLRKLDGSLTPVPDIDREWRPTAAGPFAEEYVPRVLLVARLNERWKEGWMPVHQITSENGLGRIGPDMWVLYKRRDAS